MDCTCSDYEPIELYRQNINRRIKDTKRIKERLTPLAEHPSKMHKLLKCQTCGQFWQSSYAWNWGGKEYIYKVPPINLEDWAVEAYIQPDQLLIYNAVMSRWYERNHFKESEKPCRREGCPNHAVEGLIQCLDHHIEDLQRTGALPNRGDGRWFAPYRKSTD